MKINKMMAGDTGTVSVLSQSRWWLLGEVGRVVQGQSGEDSLQSHGRAGSLALSDRLLVWICLDSPQQKLK